MSNMSDSAQESENWRAFLEWLPQTAPAANVEAVLRNFRVHLLARGLIAPETDQALADVTRLMRTRPEAWPLIFDKVYSSPTPGFSTQPNALVARAAEGRSPGTALDICMGQGRNAVFLACKGWEVTGIDVSVEGLAAARAQAAQAGVGLQALHQSDETFDFGERRWDLVTVTYAPVKLTEPAYVERLGRSLRSDGVVVVESFASAKDAPFRRPVDLDPEELKKAFSSFEQVVFEETEGRSDWSESPVPLVKMIARKA